MHLHPSTDYITGSDIFSDFDSDCIQTCMDHLIPENTFIIVIDNEFKDEELKFVEPWYKLKYSVDEIPNDWIEQWRIIKPMVEFHMPESNSFLITDFNLIILPNILPESPVKIYDAYGVEVWYKPDDQFRRPECCVYLHLMIPLTIQTIESYVY